MFHMLVRTWKPRHQKLICRFCHGETVEHGDFNFAPLNAYILFFPHFGQVQLMPRGNEQMVLGVPGGKEHSGDHGFGGSARGDIGTQPDKLHVRVVNEGLRWVLSWGMSPQCAKVANMNNNRLQYCITSLFFAFISCINDTKLTKMISYSV